MTVYDRLPSAVLFAGIRYRTEGLHMVKDVGLTTYNWGVPVPTQKPSAAASSGGNLDAGTYKIHTVFRNKWGENGNPMSGDPISIVVQANYKIDLTGVPVSGDPQVSDVFFYVTTPDADAPFYFAGSVTNGTTTATISANHANWPTDDFLEPGYLTNNYEDTLAGPFRCKVPPVKRYVETFDERVFAAGERVYSSGLVSATNGGDVLTGDNGMSLDSGHVGKYITLNNENTAYKIEAVYTPKVFKIDRAYVTPSWRASDPSEVAYKITGAIHEVVFSEQGEPEYFPSINSFNVGRDEGGRITGLKAIGNDLIVATDRSLHRVYLTTDSFQPYGVTKTHSPVGCTAPRSMVEVNGAMFFWGGDGFYVFQNNVAVNISEAFFGEIQRDLKESLLQNIAGTYHDEKIYWAVPYDNDNYLDRIMIYDIPTKSWDVPWKDFEIIDMQNAVSSDTGKRYLLFSQVAGDNYALHYFDWSLYNDGAYNGDYSGTVDSATTTSITDASATFPVGGGGLAGVPVYIKAGVGAGQERRVVSNTATTLSFSVPWDTNPTDVSEYVVGVPRYRGQSMKMTLGRPHDEKTFRLAEFGLEVTQY
jgi:hypothetical protein